jgi:hypothetical protein
MLRYDASWEENVLHAVQLGFGAVRQKDVFGVAEKFVINVSRLGTGVLQ